MSKTPVTFESPLSHPGNTKSEADPGRGRCLGWLARDLANVGCIDHTTLPVRLSRI